MVFCTQCGSKCSETDKFCSSCGNKVIIPKTEEVRAPKNQESGAENESLLQWAQYEAAKCGYNVKGWDADSWDDGLALCAIIHLRRSDLIGRIDEMDIKAKSTNLQRAINCAKNDLGIPCNLTAADILSKTSSPQFEQTISGFVFQLHEYFSQAEAQAAPTPSSLPQKTFTNLEEAMQHYETTGDMPVLPGIVAQCCTCKKLGVTFKMLKVTDNYYCDGPCGKKAFLQKYKRTN